MSVPPRCLRQDLVDVRVKAQLDRLKDRLVGKGIYPIYMFTLYAINCDQHGGPSHHVDLNSWARERMSPEDVLHTIAALEAALKALKARMT